MADIIGVGEICLCADFEKKVEPVMSQVVYTLAALKKLGDETYMVSMMADDAISKNICERISLNGVNINSISFAPDKDNIVAFRTQNDEVCYYCANNAFFEMGWDYIDLDKFVDCDWCVCSISAFAGKYTRNVLMSMLRIIKGKGVKIATDISYKKPFWKDLSTYRETATEVASLSDVVIVSDTDDSFVEELKNLGNYTFFEEYKDLGIDVTRDLSESVKGAFLAGLIHSLGEKESVQRAFSLAQKCAHYTASNGEGFDYLPGLSVLID